MKMVYLSVTSNEEIHFWLVTLRKKDLLWLYMTAYKAILHVRLFDTAASRRINLTSHSYIFHPFLHVHVIVRINRFFGANFLAFYFVVIQTITFLFFKHTSPSFLISIYLRIFEVESHNQKVKLNCS